MYLHSTCLSDMQHRRCQKIQQVVFNYLCKSQAHRWGSAGTAADPEQLLPCWAKLREITQLRVQFTVKAQRTGIAGHLERKEYNPQLTNCKELTRSLSQRIIICFGTILRHFCLFPTGLCISLELEKWESIPQLGHYSGVQELYFLPLQHPPPAQVKGTGHIHLHHPGAPTRTVQLPHSGTSTDAKLVSAACEVQTPVNFWITIQQRGGFTS